MGLEPTTFCLASRHSTTELYPLILSQNYDFCYPYKGMFQQSTPLKLIAHTYKEHQNQMWQKCRHFCGKLPPNPKHLTLIQFSSLERVAGIEPVLSSLEGLGTTPIPYPRISLIYRFMPGCQDQIMCKITGKYSTTYLSYN